jgi:hypothetical protein
MVTRPACAEQLAHGAQCVVDTGSQMGAGVVYQHYDTLAGAHP